MMRTFRISLCALCCGGVFSAATARAAEPVKPGSKAPVWSALPGTDGKKHSLADYKDAKVVVLAFTCNSCPYSVKYEDRFSEFANEYAPKGVAFVAVNVNNEDEDRLPAMKQRAKEKKFRFDYVYDESQKIGQDYGAQATPHLFVLDKDRNVAYVGSFDNRSNPKRVTKRFVKDAVDALLAGAKPSVPKTRAAGCRIRYE